MCRRRLTDCKCAGRATVPVAACSLSVTRPRRRLRTIALPMKSLTKRSDKLPACRNQLPTSRMLVTTLRQKRPREESPLKFTIMIRFPAGPVLSSACANSENQSSELRGTCIPALRAKRAWFLSKVKKCVACIITPDATCKMSKLRWPAFNVQRSERRIASSST